MPELPEVETIVRDLQPILKGLRFKSIDSSHENHVAGALDNASEIVDISVREVARRGKYIRIIFENDYVMTIHLRMSGRLLFMSLDDEVLRFERTRIDFDGGSLRFCDMRKFGRVWINKKSDYEEMTGTDKLGIEPLGAQFNLENFGKLFKGRRGVLKKWLLDQTFIAGIGNIYADEACFYAGVRPDREVAGISNGEFDRLFEGILKALNQGIRNRGTSISDFADAYGKKGKNQEVLYVYGRGGEKCLECAVALSKMKLAGRTTVFCERCQK